MAQFSYLGLDYFLVSIFFVPFLYLIFKQFNNFSSQENIPPFPPGPKPWPLVGNIPHMLGKMPHIALADISKIHGPLIMLRLGAQNVVVASSSKSAKEILKTHDRLLSARYVPMSTFNPEVLNDSSIASTDTCNDGWKYLRTLCRAELFSMKSLDAQSFLRERKVLEMIDYVKAKNEGDVVNIKELVFVTLFNMMSNVLLSRDLIGFDEKNEDNGMKGVFRKMFDNFSARNISDLYPILSKFDLQGIRTFSTKLRKRIEAHIEPIIEGRRKTSANLNQENDFLDVLLLNKFTNARIHQLFIVIFA